MVDLLPSRARRKVPSVGESARLQGLLHRNHLLSSVCPRWQGASAALHHCEHAIADSTRKHSRDAGAGYSHRGERGKEGGEEAEGIGHRHLLMAVITA